MKWATQEVPYYKRCINCKFEELPIVNKSIIKAGGNDFIAQSWLDKPLHRETTSGLTDTPFAVLQDPGKRLQTQADLLVCSDLAGFHLDTWLYYIRVWNHLNRKSKLKTLLANMVVQSSDNLSDESLEDFFKKLEDDHQGKGSWLMPHQYQLCTNG